MTVDISANVLFYKWDRGLTPGAAQRSNKTLLFSKKPYFLFSWISLNAALARYPFSLANLYHLSKRPLPCFFWIPIDGGLDRCCCCKRDVWRCRFCPLQPALKIPKFHAKITRTRYAYQGLVTLSQPLEPQSR
jgi:hypothetical protein